MLFSFCLGKNNAKANAVASMPAKAISSTSLVPSTVVGVLGCVCSSGSLGGFYGTIGCGNGVG